MRYMIFILRCLVVVLATLISTGIAIAGLDVAGRYDNVVAVYHFEDVTDSGPRDFDGSLGGNATIVNNGKIDKCLRLRGEDSFSTIDTLGFGIVDGEFSIVAWVKLPAQTDDLIFMVVGYDDDDTNIGALAFFVESDGNISGGQYDFEDSKSYSINTSDQNVTNNQWHHIAFTKYSSTYSLFIDGEQIKKERRTGYYGFFGQNTLVSVGAFDGDDDDDEILTGTVFVDELGFFETGFSVYEIKALYDGNLSDFLTAMPVDPQEKAATTWGEIKTRRY